MQGVLDAEAFAQRLPNSSSLNTVLSLYREVQDASGNINLATVCQNRATWSVKGSDCPSLNEKQAPLKPNPDGGFDAFEPGSTTAITRAFFYRAGNGDLMAMSVDSDGTLVFGTRQRTNPLPEVGTTTSFWNAYLGAALTSTLVIDARTNTIQSVDPAAQSWVRIQKTQGGNDDHPETLLANTPRSGFTTRVAAQGVPAANGTTVNVNEFTSLTMRGMGLNPLVLPGPKLFDITVQQP
jgi:hypothetical protein